MINRVPLAVSMSLGRRVADMTVGLSFLSHYGAYKIDPALITRFNAGAQVSSDIEDLALPDFLTHRNWDGNHISR